MKIIKVAVAGPRGRMGKEAVAMVLANEHFELVAVVDHQHGGEFLLSEEWADAKEQRPVPIFSDCLTCFQSTEVDVLVDFTTPEVGMENTEIALMHQVRPVVGTTGFTDENLQFLKQLASEQKIGAVIAPNFALGAVLMMKFAKMATKYYSDIEIIEMHHDQKLDAPSGTAIKTAETIASERTERKQGHQDEKELIGGARGADYQGMKIHSIRLPGLVAHQQVIFGGTGETLTIRHDSFHRSSFMTGVGHSIETVMKLDTLVYGLENILD